MSVRVLIGLLLVPVFAVPAAAGTRKPNVISS